VLAIGENGEPNIEAFEMTGQFLQLVHTKLFVSSENPSISKTTREIYVDRQYSHSIDNDYFILPIGISPFESFLHTSFPVENRKKKATLQEHVRRTLEKFLQQGFPLLLLLSDFHLLLFLTNFLDLPTICEITSIVKERITIPEGYSLLITSLIQ